MRQASSAASGHRLKIRALAAAAIVGTLTACAQPPRLAAGEPPRNHWFGRLALQVEDAASQSFSAGFELQGQPDRGQLTLFNPLGNVMALLEWTPEQATLISGEDRRTSDSLEALVQELLGSSIPIAALFDWLQGRASQAAGWQVDLSAASNGRIVAERTTPPPQATLRIALTR